MEGVALVTETEGPRHECPACRTEVAETGPPVEGPHVEGPRFVAAGRLPKPVTSQFAFFS